MKWDEPCQVDQLGFLRSRRQHWGWGGWKGLWVLAWMHCRKENHLWRRVQGVLRCLLWGIKGLETPWAVFAFSSWGASDRKLWWDLSPAAVAKKMYVGSANRWQQKQRIQKVWLLLISASVLQEASAFSCAGVVLAIHKDLNELISVWFLKE